MQMLLSMFMDLGDVNIHVIPSREHLVTVLAGVGQQPGEVYVLHVLDGTASITVYLWEGSGKYI